MPSWPRLHLTGTTTAACALALLMAAPAQAVVPSNGWGIANHLEDPGRQQSTLDFDTLAPHSFRFIAEWESLDSQAYRDKVQAVINEANEGARRSGRAMDIAVSFSCPRAGQTGFPPDELAWIAPVGRFVDRFTGDVEWWGSVNEPNHSDCVLRSGFGPDLAAAYSTRLHNYLTARPQFGDGLLSPDFHDHYSGSTLAMTGAISTVASYIEKFRAAGGKFGSAVAWHPYGGIERRSMLSTNDLASTLDKYSATRNLPIWATEAGGLVYLKNASAGDIYQNDLGQQNDRVAFIRDVLARHAKVARIYYYNMRHDNNPRWDSALVSADGVRRPAWYTWCDASRNSDAACYDDSPAAASWGPFRLDVFFRGSGDDAPNWQTGPVNGGD